MIFHGRFLTKHDGLRTDSLRRLNRSTTKRKVVSDRQLVSGRQKSQGEFRFDSTSGGEAVLAKPDGGASPSSMSSSVLWCPSPMAKLPLITGFAGILGGSSVSPAGGRGDSEEGFKHCGGICPAAGGGDAASDFRTKRSPLRRSGIKPHAGHAHWPLKCPCSLQTLTGNAVLRQRDNLSFFVSLWLNKDEVCARKRQK